MKTDLVKALGLNVYKGRFIVNDGAEFVFVGDLRAALEKLPVVRACAIGSNPPDNWASAQTYGDTHIARLFAIEEIKRDPVKWSCEQVATSGRIEIPYDFKDKRIKVTVEEIVGER